MSNKSNRFKNRESSNSNRRRLVIESQNENEIIAQIYRADTNVVEEGTKIDADVLNDWDGKVDRAFALTQTPNVNEASIIGTPRVEITEDGRLKFIALKGATGATGPTGIQGPQGATGPQGAKGDMGNSAGFGEVTANAFPLEVGSEPQARVSASGENTAKNFTFEFGLPKGIKGDPGTSIFVRYSFDKTTMTEQPESDTRYIGFYTGMSRSENPSDYKWTHLWGAISTGSQEYSDMLYQGRLDQEKIYFVDGASEDRIEIGIDRAGIALALGIDVSQLQQLAELAKILTVTGTENKEISIAASSLNILQEI